MNNKNKSLQVAIVFLVILCFLAIWNIYVPKSIYSDKSVIFVSQKGMSNESIATELKNYGMIKSKMFFKLYSIISGSYSKLQAGRYELKSTMSIAQIVKKMAFGDVIREKITIIEGWNLKDIAKYLENKKWYSQKDFLALTENDWSHNFEFLKDKPRDLNLEGYIFPDTYEISSQQPEDFLKIILSNFDKKLTADLRKEISIQNKSIFQVITMASILEKEVKSLEDKKIVSGILWKRIKEGMPLQVDATINFITGKNNAKATINDTKIDSLYNTYKYDGLPLGPISNPGIDSILAAIYPAKSPYWYYLSADGDGTTIFSKTLEEHNIAKIKYLK